MLLYEYLYIGRIEHCVPKRLALVNGKYAVYSSSLFAPWVDDKKDDWERDLTSAIERTVELGDTVILVGGGIGVSSLATASEIGKNGELITYEANPGRASALKKTIWLNDVDDIVSIKQAAVGDPKSVYGRSISSKTVSPSDLSSCDALILDCEGAELEIIEDMSIGPDKVIVEYHADLGSSEHDVRNALCDKGYTVISHDQEIPGRGILIAEI
ncbi:hypothetical protein GCM10028857_21490 [Salinarchaeum chitinilyticum]